MIKGYRLIIIGAGPAGLSAALGAGGIKDILLIDRNPDPGGLLRQCIHTGFGHRFFGEDLTGPECAERLVLSAGAAGVDIMTDTSVINISHNKVVTVAGQEGICEFRTEALILASGCRERAIGSLPVCGTRPAGVFPAGSVQKMINIGGYDVGDRIVILGSGDVGLIAARRLTLEGKKVLAVIEKENECGGLMFNKLMCLDAFGIPLLTQSTVSELYGSERLTGVRICPAGEEKSYDIECDTLVTSLGLIPETDLLRGLDRQDLPWIFVCGNARAVSRFADDVIADGKTAGENAAAYLRDGRASFVPPPSIYPPEDESNFVCLFCPKSCALKIEKGVVSGGLCREQDLFISRDFKSVKFSLTATVKTEDGKRLPVRTSDRIPLADFTGIMTELKGVTVSGNVSQGQAIISDVCGKGTDIIATTSIDQRTLPGFSRI